MTALGNTRLVQYGIQTEKSDLRAHVCVMAKALYVYATAAGVECLRDPRYREGSARTGELVTARGRLVPPRAISGCMRTDIPQELLDRFNIKPTDHPTDKGKKAAQIVAAMIEDALFPFPMKPSVITSTSLQFEGLDIVVSANVRIQVKCDYRGGEKEIGGETGNLFLQTAECNPYRAH